MRQGGGGGGSNPTDQTTNFFWMAILLLGLAILFWYFEKAMIVHAIFAVRRWELDIILGFAKIYDPLASFFHIPGPDVNLIHAWQQKINIYALKQVTFHEVVEVSVFTGQYFGPPTAVLSFVLALFLYFKHGNSKFRRTYNLKSLKGFEVENWPQITPVVNLNLTKVPLDEGPWAMADRPLEFGRKYDLLAHRKSRVSDDIVYTVKRGPAQRVFVMQLGSLWRDPRRLPVHIQALFVIFVARAKNDRTLANGLIKQIAASASEHGKLNFAGVAEAMENYHDCGLVKWVAKRHFYVNTFMSTLLDIARTDGVLATSEFLWLKPVDRRLWYTLNNVGRQTAFPEVAGIFAHWLAERKVGHGVRVPMVKEAVAGLEVALEEILYEEEDDKWRNAD